MIMALFRPNLAGMEWIAYFLSNCSSSSEYNMSKPLDHKKTIADKINGTILNDPVMLIYAPMGAMASERPNP